MGGLINTSITAMTTFAATNLDDIVILMVFFLQVNATFRSRHIVTGQYLGFIVLILASIPGFLGGLILPEAWIGLLGFLPIAIGVKQWINLYQDEEIIQTVSDELGSLKTGLISSQTYHVAAVTVANGGDNIGIYVPLFAGQSLVELLVTLAVFFVLIGAWCYVAYRLIRYPAIAHVFTRYGHQLVPFILVGLGLSILIESGTYKLLPFLPLNFYH
jgi:cadmium resistance transport/sequestration family protein